MEKKKNTAQAFQIQFIFKKPHKLKKYNLREKRRKKALRGNLLSS